RTGGPMSRRLSLFLVASLLGLAAPASAAPPKAVLVMPFELVDTSQLGDLEGPSKVDQERLREVTRYAEGLIAESPRFRIVDRSAVQGLLSRFRQTYAYTYRCDSCAVEAARKAGADLVISGWEQKVSNLIRNLTLRVQDARTGSVVAGGWTSLRGNTLDMLEHAAYRVVTDHILRSPVSEGSGGGSGSVGEGGGGK
ncbi:MAG TPA: DUF3280 domain-containing protein, partial [Gammaproteobacteria bacterium]|nr:DUF3280 domain-containing protein [Gammaproteobacteria bacterium]